jgi:glycosyltransferase involved in cell wall biosynthesis
MGEKTGVLFIQSHEGFGADAVIHAHIMRHLDRARFEVHVACSAGDGTSVPRPLQIFREIPDLRVRPTHFMPGLRGRSVASLLAGAKAGRHFPKDFADLRRYVKANRIRVIHSGDHPRDCVTGVLLGKVTGVKSIVHVHVKWASHYSAPAKWAVRSADAILGISKYVTGTVVGMGRAERDVHTVLNCVDVTAWDPDTDGSGIRREFGIAPDAPLIASVSRLFSWKGQRELLQAFAAARAQLPALKLLIVGADEREAHTGSFTEELKALAAQLGVTEHVVFTGARSDVAKIMAACDVFTLPSFEEPFGLVFLEAMAMRRPIAALDNGGTPEVVEHGKSGLLSAPYDIPAYTANILTLLGDGELRARMGRHGRQRVVDFFNAQRMVAETAGVYEKVLAS